MQRGNWVKTKKKFYGVGLEIPKGSEGVIAAVLSPGIYMVKLLTNPESIWAKEDELELVTGRQLSLFKDPFL